MEANNNENNSYNSYNGSNGYNSYTTGGTSGNGYSYSGGDTSTGYSYTSGGTNNSYTYTSGDSASSAYGNTSADTNSSYSYSTSDGSSPAADDKASAKKPMSPMTKRIIAGALVVCLSGCAGFGGGALAMSVFGGGNGGSQTISIDNKATDSLNAASAIAEKVMPSVVGISTVQRQYTQTFFGIQQGTATGVGTGIIVSEDGYILTNSHVVNDGDTEKITVDLYDGTEYEGTVLWNDASLDLAIVKIDAKGLTAAELGDSDDVSIGDYALAVGNPLGLNFERSMTQGIISGLNRTITTSDSSSGTTNTMEGLIQTDASINSGNSGGPLINSEGKVIGINSAKASSAEGLGFAIPINTAIPIIDEIKEKGTYEQAYIGVNCYDVSVISSYYNTDFKTDKGVYITQIYTNTPAASSGLQEGDIITKIDGDEIDGKNALKTKLTSYRPGDTITITIERNKETKTVELTLGAESESTTPDLQKSSDESSDQSQQQNGSNGTVINPFGSNQWGSFFNFGN